MIMSNKETIYSNLPLQIADGRDDQHNNANVNKQDDLMSFSSSSLINDFQSDF